MSNLTLNRALHDGHHESNFPAISMALVLSLVLHFAIMRALPWLEAIKAKTPIEIIAELQPLPPPPATEAPSEMKQVETPIKPVVTKTEHKPTPVLHPNVLPTLTAEHTESVSNDYSVPETHQQEPSSSEAVTPAVLPTSPSAASSAKSEVVSSNSTSSWNDSEIWDDYGSSLQKLIDGYKQYPAIAVRRGWQGLAKVLVRFSPEGKAIIILIEKSTGQKVLDDKALEMVKKSISDLPVPNKFRGREFRVSIPVSFKLE